MLKCITAVSGAAIAAALVGAGLAALSASVAPEAKAAALITTAAHQPLAKAGRVAVLGKGAACSSRSWPYYDQGCQFDLRRSSHDARTVRIIGLRG